MGLKTRFSAIALTVCMTLSAIPVAAFAEETSESTIARINVQGERAAAYMVISEEFAAKGQDVKLVYNADAQAGDILVETKEEYKTAYGSEGYGISVDNDVVTVKAFQTAGASYGLRDVLKQLESDGTVETKTSVPFRQMRALFVDCARKYFSVEWFETIIREMAWNGMNTLYMSFSNDEGFRFLLDDMSISYEGEDGEIIEYDNEFMQHLGDNPATLSDSEFLMERNAGEDEDTVAQKVLCYDDSEYLTQDDMLKILSYADIYGIKIIPEFNGPGHNGQILWYFPEYRNEGIWGIDTNPCYALDLENQEAKNFMAAMVKKYVDFFYENGCTDFCVGGDEFAAHGSSNQTIANYVNELVNYVESKEMTAYAWVDGQAGESGLLKKSVIVNDWKSGGAKASDYQVVNFNSDHLYHVLKVGDWWKVKPKDVFDTWNPLLFNGNSQVNPNSDAASNVLGACIAIWCDDANAKTADVILTEMMTNLKSFGYRTWNYDPNTENAITYEEFIENATDAAALEEAGVLGAIDAMKEISVLEEQLKEADKNAGMAQTAAVNAQNRLDEAEKRVTAAEQKAAAAQNQMDKLTAEAELCTARAEANKLAVEVAEKNAQAAKLKASLSKIEAQILGLDGNAEDAAAKDEENKNLTAEVSRQENAAKELQSAQTELDKAAEVKKAELEKVKNSSEAVTTTVKDINYKILDTSKKTATVTGTANKNLKNAVIQAEVDINGTIYEVTQIDAKAFKGLKQLKKVTIGSNIQIIQKQAFAQCSKLANINMKKAMGITSIKGKAFSKISAKAKVTVPAKKKDKYKKLLKKGGLSQKAAIK